MALILSDYVLIFDGSLRREDLYLAANILAYFL